MVVITNKDGERVSTIRCRGVTKTYGEGNGAVEALRGVDLELRSGELTMLSGPSGCGKTTLIAVLAGLLDRDGGECSVLGSDLSGMTRAEVTRFRGRNFGFVFQSFDLVPALTAAENAATPLLIRGERKRTALGKADAVLGSLGFDGDMMRRLPAELSGGQQQRVAIARALIHEPRVIFCDEPTSALDSETGHGVMELMRRMVRSEDRILVVVTHDSRIHGFADRIARMEDGRISNIEAGPRLEADPRQPE